MKQTVLPLAAAVILFGSALWLGMFHKAAATAHEGTFGTALNCIDGRTQIPVSERIKRTYHVDYVDTITFPGMDKALSEASPAFLEQIKRSVLISINAHHSKVIAVTGHYDCAANPVSEREHKKQILRAVDIIRSWKLPVPVVGLWVNDQWKAEIVKSVSP